MFGQSQLTRSLVAIVGALLVSSVTVSAAIAPAQAFANPIAAALLQNVNA